MKEKNSKSIFENAFLRQLIDNKLYLLSFIITIVVLGYGLSYILRDSDGLVTKRNKAQLQILKELEEEKKKDNGYYSFNVVLNKKVDIGTCSITSYSYIYEVDDNKMTKYFSNHCLGTIKLLKDNRPIINNYSFKIDDITYTKDSSVTKIVEDSNSSVNLYFYNNNIILLSDDDLVLLNNNEVSYISSELYKSSGGNISKRYYKSKEEDTFKYIVFYNNEDVSCYDEIDPNKKDEVVYDIYQIHYNTLLNGFDEPKKITSRNKGNFCLNYDSDIDLLKQ